MNGKMKVVTYDKGMGLVEEIQTKGKNTVLKNVGSYQAGEYVAERELGNLTEVTLTRGSFSHRDLTPEEQAKFTHAESMMIIARTKALPTLIVGEFKKLFQ